MNIATICVFCIIAHCQACLVMPQIVCGCFTGLANTGLNLPVNNGQNVVTAIIKNSQRFTHDNVANNRLCIYTIRSFTVTENDFTNSNLRPIPGISGQNDGIVYNLQLPWIKRSIGKYLTACVARIVNNDFLVGRGNR